MKYRVLLTAFFYLLLSQIAGAFDNVLVITIDTLRADYVGCYGSKKVKTPNIDSIAAKGVMFRNTVASAPFTLPSHISIMTGLIPPAHGVQDNGGFYLEKRITTLAEKYKAAGMNTAAFVGAFPLDSRFGLDQGFDVYDDQYPTFNNVTNIKIPERRGDEVTNLALKWYGQIGKKPWFSWVHYYDPHFPYQPPEPYKTRYASDPYAGEIAFVDEQVGRILTYLRQSGLESKTLIVLTADHGESLGQHLEETHGIFAYESTLRVPLIFSPLPLGSVDQRVRLIDVAPTVLELTNQTFTGKIQGQSLKRWMQKTPPNAPPENSYFEALSMYLSARWAPLRGYYSGDMKFIELPLPELYNVAADPQELKNLCADKKLCDQWNAKFTAYFEPYRKAAIIAAPVDSETAEQLRALGYVSGSSSGPAPANAKFGPADDPKNMISIHNRVDTALQWYNKGYDLKALEILEKIIEEKPAYSVAYMHASYIYSSGGFPDKSVTLLNKAIANGIDGSVVRGKLGVYLFETGRYEEAARELNKALKDDPKEVDNWNFLGISQTRAGKFAEAEAAFRKALEIDPRDGATLTNLGTLYLTQKNFDKAVESLQKAVSVNPHMASAYNGLGVVYASRKNWDEAIRYWALAVQNDSNNYDAMLNLGYAYLQRNDKANALEVLQKFQNGAPPAKYAADLAKVRNLIRQLQ